MHCLLSLCHNDDRKKDGLEVAAFDGLALATATPTPIAETKSRKERIRAQNASKMRVWVY